MANVQKENGYTEIANELLEALYQVPLSSTEFRILLYILRKTYGFKKKSDWISQKQIAKEFGIYKQHVSRAIKELKTKNMITNNIEKNKKILGVQKDYGKWELPKLVTNKLQELVTNKNKVTRIGYQSNQNRLPKVTKIGTHKRNYTKETITKEIYIDILDYWNKKGIIQHTLTKNLETQIRIALKKFKKEDICLAINNYSTALKDSSYFYDNLWTLLKFLKQGNGIPEWLEDGSCWINYQKKNKPKQKIIINYPKLLVNAKACWKERDRQCDNPTYTAAGNMLEMCKICKDNKGGW